MTGLVAGENFYYIMKINNLRNLSGTAWNMNRSELIYFIEK